MRVYLPLVLIIASLGCSAAPTSNPIADPTKSNDCSCNPDFLFEDQKGEALLISFLPFGGESRVRVIASDCKNDRDDIVITPRSVDLLESRLAAKAIENDGFGYHAIDATLVPIDDDAGSSGPRLEVTDIHQSEQIFLEDLAELYRANGRSCS